MEDNLDLAELKERERILMKDLPHKDWIIGGFVAIGIVGLILVFSQCNFFNPQDEPPDKISKDFSRKELVLPTTHTWKVSENIVGVSIDGTNEYEKDKIGRGHDPNIWIKAGEEITIEYVGGWITYILNNDLSNPKWGKATYYDIGLPRKLVYGESIRYTKHEYVMAVFIILRTAGGEEEFYDFPNSGLLKLTNPFQEDARAIFFFNGLEKIYTKNHELVDAYQFNGKDPIRSRMTFHIDTLAGKFK